MLNPSLKPVLNASSTDSGKYLYAPARSHMRKVQVLLFFPAGLRAGSYQSTLDGFAQCPAPSNKHRSQNNVKEKRPAYIMIDALTFDMCLIFALLLCLVLYSL